VGTGELSEIGIGYLPMADHTGQRDVSERDLIGPELVPRLRRDDSQLVEGLIRTHSPPD
jgi:hypothetical protein